MKKILYSFIAAGVASLAIVSCNKTEIDTPDQAPTIHLQLTANLDTKTAVVDPGTGLSYGVQWTAGDKLGVFEVADGNVQAKQTSEALDADGETKTFNFALAAVAGSSPYDYTFVYPADAVSKGGSTESPIYRLSIADKQTFPANSFDKNADLLVSEHKSLTEQPTDLTLNFARVGATARMVLTGITSTEIIKTVKFSTTEGNIAGYKKYNPQSGDIDAAGEGVYSGQKVIELTPEATDLALNGDVVVWFRLYDITLTNNFTVFVKTDAAEYTKAVDLATAGKSLEFKNGALTKFTVDLSSANRVDTSSGKTYNLVSATSELTSGATYLIVAENEGNYYALGEQNTNNRAAASVTENNDVVTVANATSVYPVIIEAVTGGYTIKDVSSNSYLYASSTSSNQLKSTNDPSDTKAVWTIEINNGVAHITNVGNTSRGVMRFNPNPSGNPLFAAYQSTSTTGTADLALYVDPVSLVPALDSPTNVEAIVVDDDILVTWDDITAPSGETVTYSVTCTGQAAQTIAQDVESCTFEDLADGTYEITVTAVPSTTYYVASAPVSVGNLVVSTSPVVATNWELVTDFSSIESGGKYIFVNVQNSTSYYMKASTCNIGSGTQCTELTLLPTESGFVETDDMLLFLTGNTTDGFIVSNHEGKQLYIKSTNNGLGFLDSGTTVKFYTDSNVKGYTLSGYDDASTPALRYVGMNSATNFRCYNSVNNNVKTGEYVWYHRIAAPDTRDEAPISWSSDAGTATWSSSGISSTLPSLSNTGGLNVSYSSSVQAVATVANDGTVTILSGGSTTISATYDGSDPSAPYKTTTVSYTLTVTDSRTVAATPSFSPAAGEVELNSTVIISCATEGATIHYTVDGSTPTTASATYTSAITIDGPMTIKAIAVKANYKNSEVASATYTIAASASTIAQVLAAGPGQYTINNILIYSVVGNQAIVGDSTGKMVLYKQNHGLEVGDIISIPAATVAEHSGILQIQDGTFSENSNGNAVDHGTATDLNDAAVATSTQTAFSAAGYHAASFVTLNGTKSGRNINGTNAKLYLSANDATADGKVVVTGYIYYYNSSYTNYNFQLVSITEDTTTPSVSVEPSTLNWTATETGSKTLTVTLNGSVAIDHYGYTVTSGTESDWNISKSGAAITVSPKAANTSTTDAKSITIRISHADDSTVYQDVTCTQAKASSGTGGTLTIDFESAADTYTDWTITTIKTQQTNSNVPAHGGSYYGGTDGKASGSIVTKNKITSPGEITFYVSKESTNTTASSWKVSVSTDGTTWTQVGDAQSASAGITRGTWTEVTRDLSSYSDVYIKVEYDGTTAKRCIDDLTLTYN